jgi:hypothetical protein
MRDMDRILSNFLPFANQSFFVKSPNPKSAGQTIKHEVIWNGEISQEDNSEVSTESGELITASTSFTFKTWIWPGATIAGATEGIINKINITPSLCSLGVQHLLYKNGVTDAASLCALSGFMLDDTEYYGDIYSLSHWYAVPTETTFTQFEGMLELGRIDPLYYDTLPISGGVSGYVRDLGMNLSEGDAFTLSGSEVYYVDQDGGLVIYASTSALSEPFSAACL